MDRRFPNASAFCLASIAVLGVAGCGGASHKGDQTTGRLTPLASSVRPAPGGAAQSGPVVAEVAGTPIYKSALEHRMAIETRAEASGDRQTLMRKVLGPLISGQWVIGEAAQEGVEPTEAQVRQRFEHLKAVQFGTEAKFQAFLSQTGENVPDLLFAIKEQLAARKVFDKIHSAVGRVTPATISRYYSQNKALYAVSEKRDLGLIHTKTAAEAAQVKRELGSGVSFASVAKRLAKQQPIYTSKGLLTGLRPHIYAQKVLNDAIFSARPHVVSGPVSVHLTHGVYLHDPRDIQNVNGYYVFELFKVEPANQQTLAQVKATIAKQLPTTLYKQAVAAFVKKWRARWIANTDCHAGYVIRKCRQFKHPERGEEREDGYTLN